LPEDLNEVIAAFVQDKANAERGLFDEEPVPQELTQLAWARSSDKYPDLDAEEQEAVRQHAIAALNLTQKAKQLALGDGEKGNDEKRMARWVGSKHPIRPSTALLDGVRNSRWMYASWTSTSSTASIRGSAAYAVLAKSMRRGEPEGGRRRRLVQNAPA
jgi:hypothetical protein